jgi:hypothetical protein
MPDLTFTREEVEAKAGKQPWQRQRAFAAEIRPDDMADTAAVYARAAGEAGGAGELARHAGEVGVRAGELDGTPLMDADGRIDTTARDLQGNGTDMDGVVGYLVRAMNRALDADDEVRDLVLGPEGLDVVYQRELTAAVTEWNGLVHTLTPELVDTWARDIRERHLKAAADEAVRTDRAVGEAITAYRTTLLDYGRELSDLGYDPSDGPLGLWTTEGMGTFVGQRISAALRGDPDLNALLRWTEGLDWIRTGFANPDGSTQSLRFLTDGERDYLLRLFRELDAGELAKLGQLTDLHPLSSPDREVEIQRRIANGITMLTDGENGGLDLMDEGGARIPEGIRTYVYDYRDTGLWPVGGSEYLPTLEKFNHFGHLMWRADVPPGNQFAQAMATAAVDVQGRTNAEYLTGESQLNHFSTGLLHTAAQNGEAAATLLNDDTFRRNLLGQVWQDSAGAAEFVHSGVRVPEGMDQGLPTAEPYVRAAYHVLADAPDHRDTILAERGPLGEPAYHRWLQSAVANTALAYQDRLTTWGPDTAFTEPVRAPAEPDLGLYGDDAARYSFRLSREDGQALLDLIDASDEETREYFRESRARALRPAGD